MLNKKRTKTELLQAEIANRIAFYYESGGKIAEVLRQSGLNQITLEKIRRCENVTTKSLSAAEAAIDKLEQSP